MSDSGASFSCRCTTSNVIDCLRALKALNDVRSRASARKTGARIWHRIYGADFWACVRGLTAAQKCDYFYHHYYHRQWTTATEDNYSKSVMYMCSCVMYKVQHAAHTDCNVSKTASVSVSHHICIENTNNYLRIPPLWCLAEQTDRANINVKHDLWNVKRVTVHSPWLCHNHPLTKQYSTTRPTQKLLSTTPAHWCTKYIHTNALIKFSVNFYML